MNNGILDLDDGFEIYPNVVRHNGKRISFLNLFSFNKLIFRTLSSTKEHSKIDASVGTLKSMVLDN